ncbi:integrase core domain containing [Brachionus plicatilis]|uniref:Integrase core domain containing n=1 Tax=Brachionus plicatilis TaxID=10195 RepID=A0A3M7SB24_BRAPC|nr:integrase core domain containing [Brachionus plicatilis]
MVSSLSNNINCIPSTTGYVGACENKIKTATGIITHASGKTKPIEIKLGNKLCLIEFIVFDHEDHDKVANVNPFSPLSFNQQKAFDKILTEAKCLFANSIEELWSCECTVCNRNNKEIVKYHPAETRSICKIFKRVMIDLILGLPETDESFNGILIFVCETNTIKIGMFGPFEELLSDQGREFCNNVLKSFKNITTSAYKPRTNGIKARFNQTLANCLRKHAEANINKWHKFLPFVLIAYQSRVHSAPGHHTFTLEKIQVLSVSHDLHAMFICIYSTDSSREILQQTELLISEPSVTLEKIKC